MLYLAKAIDHVIKPSKKRPKKINAEWQSSASFTCVKKTNNFYQKD